MGNIFIVTLGRNRTSRVSPVDSKFEYYLEFPVTIAQVLNALAISFQ